MWFIDRLLGMLKKRRTEPVYEHVELPNLIFFLKDRNRVDISEIAKEDEYYKNRVIKDFVAMRELNESLNRIKAFDILSRASVEVKNNFCEKTRNLLAHLPSIEQEPEDFVSQSREIMERMNSITPRQAIHIGIFFKEHVNKMADHMKSINQILEEYEEFVSTSMLNDLKEIEKLISSIRESESKFMYLEKNISDIENEASHMKESEQKHASKIPHYDLSKIDDLKLDMEDLKKEKQMIEQEIDTIFGGLARVMKKYSHESGDKKSRALIEKYLSSSSWAFLTHDRDMDIKKILNSIKEAIESNNLECDEKQYIHLGSVISNMVGLRKTRDKYDAIMNRIYEKEAELMKEEKFSEKLGRMNDELKEVRNKISERNSMKSQLEESKARLSEEMRQKIKEIEFIVNSDLGINLRIDYDIPGQPKELKPRQH